MNIYVHVNAISMGVADSEGQFGGLTFEEFCEAVGAIASEYGTVRVYLFGSRARGDNRPDSDYDFCVVPGDDCTLFTLGGFYGKLEEALGMEVDVVCKEALREDFERNISSDLRLVYPD